MLQYIEELCRKHQLLTCGIEKIDSILKLTRGDRLAIISNKKYSQVFVTRLCVNALLSSSSSQSLSKKKNNSKLIAGSRRLYTSNVIHVAAGCIEKYRQYMKLGDMLPPMAEIDAMLSTNELLDETKAILDRNIKPLFNEAIYKKEVRNALESRHDEIKKLLKKKVKFIDENEDEDDENH